MDFIEGLPKSQGKEVILVVVGRYTKYAHFIALSHPYTVHTVAQAFVDTVFRLHGTPVSIITDRDRIFTSNMWQGIFKAMKIELKMSTAHHPQTDGQSERVNQCLESYLRCMAFQEPKKWAAWLPLAEWWYNTSYHTATRETPFKALYGYDPPMISEVAIPGPSDAQAKDFLSDKQNTLRQLKHNLQQAQERMKKYADINRSERKFKVGGMVYLRMQPYRMASFGLRQVIKLTTKFCGPFRVMEKIGNCSYRLLPPQITIHPVFHVSQLKAHKGTHAVPAQELPLIGADGRIRTEPVHVLETRSLPRNGVLVTQWLIQWANLPPEEPSWEDANFIKRVFPVFFKSTIQSWFPDSNT